MVFEYISYSYWIIIVNIDIIFKFISYTAMTLINNASLNIIEFPYIFFYGLVKIYVYKMFYVIKKKKKIGF